MSWYRTYRPSNFADLVGQDYIRKILTTALQKNTVVHAYLFSGSRGTGKTSTARIFGKALNCLNLTPEGEPCNACQNCLDIDEQRFVDLIEIDAASNTGVDHIRDLRDKIGFSPTQGKAKVYIIDEVHMLSTGAFNALLKTLEEPPDFVYFILATTEIHKVPETIQSRCQRFAFRHITPEEIVQRLMFIAEKEQIRTEKEALEILAEHAAGGLRDAISVFEQYATDGILTADELRTQMGLIPHTALSEFFGALESGDGVHALNMIDGVVREGFSLAEFARSFLLFLRAELLTASREGKNTLPLLELSAIFEKAQRDIKFAVIPQLPLEGAVIRATQTGAAPKEESKKIFGFFGGEKKPASSAPATEKETPKSEPESAQNSAPEKEEPSAEFLAPELSVAGLKRLWPKILEELKSSLLRMALRNAEILSLHDDTLTLQFPALTWKEQVEKMEHQREFIAALEKIFSRNLTIVCLVQSVQLEPTITEKPTSLSGEEDFNALEALQEIMGVTAQKKEEEQ